MAVNRTLFKPVSDPAFFGHQLGVDGAEYVRLGRELAQVCLIYFGASEGAKNGAGEQAFCRAGVAVDQEMIPHRQSQDCLADDTRALRKDLI